MDFLKHLHMVVLAIVMLVENGYSKPSKQWNEPLSVKELYAEDFKSMPCYYINIHVSI